MQCKNQKQRQFAAYGRTLAQRQLFKNRPLLVIICTGGDSWTRVKKWQQHTNFAALVLTPEQRQAALKWPVSRYPVLVEWYTGPDENLIIEMVKCLHKAGAFFITVAPLFVDYSTHHPKILTAQPKTGSRQEKLFVLISQRRCAMLPGEIDHNDEIVIDEKLGHHGHGHHRRGLAGSQATSQVTQMNDQASSDCLDKESKLAEYIANCLRNILCYDEIDGDWYSQSEGLWRVISEKKSTQDYYARA